jgi:hypothetical protein
MSDSFRALVDKAVEVLQRHAPPDGLSDHDALTELYGIFDGPEYRSACEARSAIACIYGEPCAHPEKCKLYGECYRKLSANPSHVAPLGRIVEALRPVVSDIFDNFGTYSRGMALSMLVEAVRGIAPRANEQQRNEILSAPTSPQGPLELTPAEVGIHDPAPEREGEIAGRERLDPEGHGTARMLVERAPVEAQNGVTGRRDAHLSSIAPIEVTEEWVDAYLEAIDNYHTRAVARLEIQRVIQTMPEATPSATGERNG